MYTIIFGVDAKRKGASRQERGVVLSEVNFLLGQKIFQKIRQDIVTGKYDRDEELKELQIASEIGVSRTPVREALRQLEREGLVTIIPNKGTYVLGVMTQDMKDIYEIRAALEGLCAMRATQRLTKEKLEVLEEVLYLARFHLEKEHQKQLIELSGKFHEILYELSGGRMLQRILQNYYLYLERARNFLFSVPENAAAAVEEHQQILDAIKEKDEEKAEYADRKSVV